MRVRQHAQFVIKSETLTPEEITQLVGIEPDEAKAKGSRLVAGQPIPNVHLWALKSGQPEAATVEAHLNPLLPRLRACADGVRDALGNDGTAGWLFLGRHFEQGDEDFDESTYGLDDVPGVQRLGGQHPFLGWSLDEDVVALLASIGAGLDITSTDNTRRTPVERPMCVNEAWCEVRGIRRSALPSHGGDRQPNLRDHAAARLPRAWRMEAATCTRRSCSHRRR